MSTNYKVNSRRKWCVKYSWF